ncbi:MAG: class I SAM-dependent methyltransferase [Candidatus Peribacteraceae bacterium]|nr:class I SAM-dependent methyltransferase [Candidatus Peribacteraceae bacterium]MBP9850284.1 class I SAM-dependent methyltransferase [Candidatus Peribacteraceae bacterium]
MKAPSVRALGEVFSIVRCGTCGFLWTKNPPDERSIGRYYDTADYIPHSDRMPPIFRLIRWLRNTAKCRMLGAKQGLVVDIGCGNGTFLMEAKRRGWKTLGVDPVENARKLCSAAGIDAIMPAEMTNIPAASADVVTLWHALEHVHDLSGTLTQCRRILRSNGSLLVGVPNIASPLAAAYGQDWAGLDMPLHLWHFTPVTMEKILRSHGFTSPEIRPTWTDDLISAILSEKFAQGFFVRGVVRGIVSAFIGWRSPGRAACPVYRFTHRS